MKKSAEKEPSTLVKIHYQLGTIIFLMIILITVVFISGCAPVYECIKHTREMVYPDDCKKIEMGMTCTPKEYYVCRPDQEN